MSGYRLSLQSGSSMVSHLRNALSRNSSIHSGSFFFAEMMRTVSSDRPLGIVSVSMSVTKPALYGFASICWILSTCRREKIVF